MRQPLPDRLRIPENARVVRFLERQAPSAHSDVADELERAVRGLRGAGTWCPDAPAYAWVAAHTRAGRIFALAYGQSALAVRLAPDDERAALADRGASDAIGPGWVRFDPFHADEPTATTRERLRRWCAAALRTAGEPG
jgi:hypothetical protein